MRFVCDTGFAAQTRSIMAEASMLVRVSTISAGKFRRYRHFRFVDYITTPSVTLKNIADVAKIIVGFAQSLWIIGLFRPDVVFAKGGFVCLPVGWAARVWRVPIVIHDSDARPGLTNRLLAPFARAIATGYPLDNYPYDKQVSAYTGVPIRAGCAPVSNERQRDAKRAYDIAPSTRLIVGVGGGLGARSINRALVESAAVLPKQSVKIIIVAGMKHYNETLELAAGSDQIEVLEFVAEGMVELLSAADIVVTRSSATSLQELAGLAKPIIAVPARQLGDQHKNAAVYGAAEAAIVLGDDALERGELGGTLKELLTNSDKQAALAHNLHQFARPHAARDVARIVIATVKK